MSEPDDLGPRTWDEYFGNRDDRVSADKERCGGTGLVTYWDGGAYIGEGCPGCIDCEPPDDEAKSE